MRLLLIFITVYFALCSASFSQKSENSFYRKAKEFRSNRKYDSSIYYFSKAKDLFEKNEDELGTALTLNYLGLNHFTLDRKKEALQFYYEAIQINKRINNTRGLVSNYNNLANYYRTENLKLSINYYKKAKAILNSEKRDKRFAIINLNIGNVYSSDDSTYFNNDSAIHYYLNALESFKKLNDSSNISLLYHNLGVLFEKQDNYDASLKNYKKSLRIAELLKDQHKLSQEQMAIGTILFKKNKIEESLKWYRKSLDIVEILDDKYRMVDLYHNIVKAKMALGEVEEASALFKKFNHLRDSLYSREKMQEIKNLETKYETEKKEAEIKEQQIAIEQKNFQKNLFLGLSILLVILIISTIWFFLQKQDYLKKLKNEEISSMKTEQELKELNAMMHGQEEERNRIASDLHDRLGARLSSIKLLFQSEQNNDPSNLKNRLLDNINEAIKETREISHNLSTDMLSRFGLETALKDMVRTINDSENLKADLSIYGLKERHSLEIERNIYHVLLELINNTIKHAEASNISLQISEADEEINVFYEDDGKGFDVHHVIDSGMGMRSIYARVNAINGAVYFNSNPADGINVVINIPSASPSNLGQKDNKSANIKLA